jgi:predicted dienelactone hydrolase
MQLLDLHDDSRQRPVPVALYSPEQSAKGAILFSVGFGGNRDGYAYLARAWAQLGYTVAVVEHVGSNLQVLKGIQRPGMRQAELAVKVGEKVREEPELLARPLDVVFVRQQLFADVERVGIAGHSFGSYTALAVLGAEVLLSGGPRTWSWNLPWIGAVLMSVQPPDSMVSRAGFGQISLPTLMLTGTRDSGMPAGVEYQQRLESFHALPPGQRYLGVLQGADHMAFAAVGLNVGPFTETVSGLTGEFWTSLESGAEFRCPSGLPVEVSFEAA